MDDGVDESARSSVSSLKSRFEQLASQTSRSVDSQLSAQQRAQSVSPSLVPAERSRSIDELRITPRLSIDGLAPRTVPWSTRLSLQLKLTVARRWTTTETCVASTSSPEEIQAEDRPPGTSLLVCGTPLASINTPPKTRFAKIRLAQHPTTTPHHSRITPFPQRPPSTTLTTRKRPPHHSPTTNADKTPPPPSRKLNCPLPSPKTTPLPETRPTP